MEKHARKFIKYCDKNDLAKVNEYLSLGVDVNTVNDIDDHDGKQSALMIACKNGHTAIVTRLVEADGLDINYEDEFGHNAANLAGYNGSTKCVDILVEIDRVDWNQADKRGRTPLFLALIVTGGI